MSLSLVRGALSCVEPCYAAAMTLRNAAYNSGLLRTYPAARPVISVGNITTGGTGKTPVVCWLAEKLAVAGHGVAILLRGYRGGDEQQMLQSMLTGTRVEANADRVAGAAAVLQDDPDVSCFVLDDGFQHRRIGRDVNLVLIDATQPFGFDHVLPRGLLREPLRGLQRADAFLITHCEAADEPSLTKLSQTLRRYQPAAPIFRAEHVMEVSTNSHRFFGFCGIGNPEAFGNQFGSKLAGFETFPDHHAYTLADLQRLQHAARAAGATTLVTTQKDLVKIARLPPVSDGLPLIAASLRLQFRGDDERELLTFVLGKISARAVALADRPNA